jgi:hypothetical protein
METIKTELSKGMSEPRSFEEIMRRSSSYVDDYTLGLQFPACDFGSYYLYAPLIGEGPCQAINLGVTIGHDTGSNVNIPQLTGDPDKIWIVTSLIFNKKSYRSFDFSSYRRSDAIYSRQGLDLQVADVARIRGSWPHFEMYFKDKDYDIVYEIEGYAGYAHWVPDHISTTMAYSYLLFPNFSFSGTITVRGEIFKVKGIGSLDHVFGRNINNPSGPVIGFWHADPVMWEDKYVSSGLYYLDQKGDPYIACGVTTLPDGGYHPSNKFKIEYLDLGKGTSYSGKEADFQIVPRKWKARLESSQGILTYQTDPVDVFDPKTGNQLIEPCVLSNVSGEFQTNNGEIIKLSGKCYNEYEKGAIDPSKP